MMTPEIVRGLARQIVQPLVPAVYSMQTVTASPTILAELPVEDLTAGILEVKVIAFKDDASQANTGVYYQGFRKFGTLTLLEYEEIIATSPEMAAMADIVNSSENIAIQVTGIDATTINWVCEIKLLTVSSNGPAT